MSQETFKHFLADQANARLQQNMNKLLETESIECFSITLHLKLQAWKECVTYIKKAKRHCNYKIVFIDSNREFVVEAINVSGRCAAKLSSQSKGRNFVKFTFLTA